MAENDPALEAWYLAATEQVVRERVTAAGQQSQFLMVRHEHRRHHRQPVNK